MQHKLVQLLILILSLFPGLKEYIQEVRKYLPSKEDVEGAANAVVRLQQTYKLDAKSFIELNAKHAGLPVDLALDEAYHIGRTAFSWEKMIITKQWMSIALEKHSKGTPNSGVSNYYPNSEINYEIDARDHMAFANFKVCFFVFSSSLGVFSKHVFACPFYYTNTFCS